MKRSEIAFGVLRLPLDYIAINTAFWLAYYLRPITDLIPGRQFDFGPELLPPFHDYIWLSLASSLFLIVMFAFNHLYSLTVNHRFSQEFFKIVFLVTAWLMFIIAYYFLVVHQLFFSRIALAHIWFFTIFFVVVGRVLIQWFQSFLLRYGIGRRKVLFIGANSLADRVYQSLKKDRSYDLIGALDERVYSRKSGSLRVIGTYSQIEPLSKKYGIEELIQADTRLSDEQVSELHAFCRSRQIKFHFIPDLVRLQRTNVDISMVDNTPLVSLKNTALDGWGHVFKRAFDFAGSLFLIILLSPLLLLVALVIWFDSGRPVIYKSRRQYRDRVFNMYKFRSMVPDADNRKGDLLKENERGGPLFKISRDPRVTKIGRLLRKTSIDELPQLFNVLKGEMSLVGPRPHLPEEIDQYKQHHYQVFAIKPGITGLAQTSGRSKLDFEEEVKLDVFYIENWSLWLDLKLILKSIGVVLRADGE